jgi:integrase
MAIYWECSNSECKRRNPVKLSQCPKCSSDKRKTPAFWINYYPVPGSKTQKMERLYGFTEKMAREAEQERRRDVRRGHYQTTNQYRTLRDVCEKYRADMEVTSPNQHNNTYLYTQRMLDYFGTNTKVERIQPEQIEDWKLSLRTTISARGRQLSEASCDRHIECGKSIWNRYLRRLYNPWRDVKRFNPDNGVTNFLSEDEVRRLLQVAGNHDRHVFETILVSLLTGLRKTNVFELRRSQVNVEYRIATVVQKGSKKHVSTLSRPVIDVLSQIPENGTDYYWINPQTGKPYTDLLKPLRTCLREAGISKPGFRWHDLRHTSATLFYRASHDLLATAQHLGHSSTAHTTRYAHLLPEDCSIHLSRVAEMIGNGNGNGNKPKIDQSKNIDLCIDHNSNPLEITSLLQ